MDDSVIYPTDYGQRDEAIFVSASDGGQYNASAPIIVNGVTIPSNTVYWDLGNVEEGITDVLTMTVYAPNGTLDGTLFSNRAFAAAMNECEYIALFARGH